VGAAIEVKGYASLLSRAYSKDIQTLLIVAEAERGTATCLWRSIKVGLQGQGRTCRVSFQVCQAVD
jgi:hypothetical protein